LHSSDLDTSEEEKERGPKYERRQEKISERID
jgi:hypothetical protein